MTYIRRQERKWKKRARIARQKQRSSEAYLMANFASMQQHRYGLKKDARIAHLAYGCMKGVPYEDMEYICYGQMKGYGSTEPNWDAVMSTVERFAKDEPTKTQIMQQAERWLSEAKQWFENNTQRIGWMNEAKELAYDKRGQDMDYLDSLHHWKLAAEANGRQGIGIPPKPIYLAK
ncbi:hypothetical protein GP486_007986 [Trichoglossum hirsutum]|uniref:Uncharacterized protein n=1 Tax=Trichoglossum hirsutum TaxID=265104 RepID=A0A9P8IBT0_9PEZI|nr:hypothetical protein GP486_007986 [Trichoglossum hirsutum]